MITSMNKAELINSVAASADVSKKEAEAVVSATFDAVSYTHLTLPTN